MNLVLEYLRINEGINTIGVGRMNDYYDVLIKKYRLNQIEQLVTETST